MNLDIQVRKKVTANMIDRIAMLAKGGFTDQEISNTMGITITKVRRHLPLSIKAKRGYDKFKVKVS